MIVYSSRLDFVRDTYYDIKCGYSPASMAPLIMSFLQFEL